MFRTLFIANMLVIGGLVTWLLNPYACCPREKLPGGQTSPYACCILETAVAPADDSPENTGSEEHSWATTYPLGKPGFNAVSQFTPLIEPVTLESTGLTLSIPVLTPENSFKSAAIVKPKHPPRIS